MKFATVEASVKKQIKASMKRIAEKLIKLNAEKADKLDFIVAFNIWTNRYISSLKENKYYNLMLIDEELLEELKSIMEEIFSKAINNIFFEAKIKDVKYPKYFVEKPATKKQIYYAKYLMDTVKNQPLPSKKYSMYEIGMLIRDLKSQIKTV